MHRLDCLKPAEAFTQTPASQADKNMGIVTQDSHSQTMQDVDVTGRSVHWPFAWAWQVRDSNMI